MDIKFFKKQDKDPKIGLSGIGANLSHKRWFFITSATLILLSIGVLLGESVHNKIKKRGEVADTTLRDAATLAGWENLAEVVSKFVKNEERIKEVTERVIDAYKDPRQNIKLESDSSSGAQVF